jgi:hypothetical protein
VASRRVETRIQSRSFEFSGVAFLGQMIAGGTRPAGISVQVLPFAAEPSEPHTINTTISAPIAAMPITAPYFRSSSSRDPGGGTDTTPERTPVAQCRGALDAGRLQAAGSQRIEPRGTGPTMVGPVPLFDL